MQVALIFPSLSANRQSIVKALKRSGATRIAIEGQLIICKALDLQGLAGIPGIDGVETAKQVPRGFSEIVRAITQVGTQAIKPGEKFYVRAVMLAKADYVERDIEFASAGALVEKLAEAGALPARNEHEADRVILVVVGKKAACVCVRGRT